MVLYQINRGASKTDAVPKISELDGASAIEKAANVILLWKIEEQSFQEHSDRGTKEYRNGLMKLAKGRHTAKSDFQLKFYGSETRLEVY